VEESERVRKELLVSGKQLVIGYLLIFVTLGAELAFVFGSSVYAAIVWPGYVVGGLAAWTVTLFYLVAGPDGMAIQQPQMEMPTSPPKTLAPAG
jgi:hypothetical protein